MSWVALTTVRTDGWFERLCEESDSGVPALCDALGRQWTGLCLVAGLQIRTVAVDPRHRELSMVHFSLGEDGEIHEMPLGELRRRLAATLRDQVELTPFPLGDDPDAGALQAFLGVRNLLLAPLFGLRLEALRIQGEEAEVLVYVDGQKTVLPVEAFFGRLQQELAELERSARTEAVMELDVAVVSEAEALAQTGDWPAIVNLLLPWASTASFMLRSAGDAELEAKTARRFADGLRLLAQALLEARDLDRAEEVLRVGMQFLRSAHAGAALFAKMGELQMQRGASDAAIGYLRRALALGAPRPLVLPVLARAYMAAARYVPAACSIESAEAVGVPAEELAGLRAQVDRFLGRAWSDFVEAFPPLDAGGATVMPPAP